MNENVYFVDETTNPPNVPQARPIENLWGILAQKVYEWGWEATTQQELISRIQSQLKKFDSIFLQSLMGGVKTKLRAIADRGVLDSYKKWFLLYRYILCQIKIQIDLDFFSFWNFLYFPFVPEIMLHPLLLILVKWKKYLIKATT